MAQIGMVKCYIATPKMHYPDDKVVLLFTNVFGLALSNMLLADDFAHNGFKTVVPDILNDDPIPEFNPDLAPFDREKWHESHGSAQTRPSIDQVIAALKREGVTSFAATGYCFGARYAVDLAFEHVVKVSVISHLGQLVIPDRLENLLSPDIRSRIEGSASHKRDSGMRDVRAGAHAQPVRCLACHGDREKGGRDRAFKDTILPADPRPHPDRSLGSEMFLSLAMRKQFDAARVTSDRKMAGKNRAFEDTVDWFTKHL
ncbi:chlorocatechol-degradation protein [Mycena leptocephala]|nr:chlorocatechol-degradation protein [Mycena leptocephala]